MSWQGFEFFMGATLAGARLLWQSAKVEIFMAMIRNRVLLDGVTEIEKSENGWLRVPAPAKVNLMLSVHGCREDGFHELTSVVAALDFGDELQVKVNDAEADTLTSDDESLPHDDTNLVMQAAQYFREATGRSERFDFRLTKRIPVGAGLGGGSSDGVAALKAMDELLGTGLSGDGLRAISSQLGSDCPFFVDGAVAVMRGRGERLEALDETTSTRLKGRRIVLFRPDFGINTAWAYGQLASRPELYEEAPVADQRIQKFRHGGGVKDLLENVFEEAVGRKFLAIPCLLEKLNTLGHNAMMSGSGSACFALVEDSKEVERIQATCLECWGEGIFWVETSIR